MDIKIYFVSGNNALVNIYELNELEDFKKYMLKKSIVKFDNNIIVDFSKVEAVELKEDLT